MLNKLILDQTLNKETDPTGSRWHSQDVDPHSTAGGYEHDASVDVVVAIDDPLCGRYDQHCCHRPDGHNRQHHAQNFCFKHTHSTFKASLWDLSKAQSKSTNSEQLYITNVELQVIIKETVITA